MLLASCSTDDRGTSGSDEDRTATTTDETGAEDMDPEELAAEAYVAGYPLLVTTRTMQRLGGFLGVNRLTWQASLSGPQSRIIVAPNRDTLYSVAVLDLRAGPMALTLPAVKDRYYTYQFLDAWTESFAYVGTRATGGDAGTWVITPPGWEGSLPDDVDVIESPTPQVFVLGRFLVDDEEDVAGVMAIRDESRLEPLTALTGEAPAPPPPALGEAAGAPQAVPSDATFFDELGDALAVNPPATPEEQAMFDRFAELGIGPGEHPAADAGPQRREELDAGAAEGSRQILDAASGDENVRNGWGVNLDLGRYGDAFDLRALVSRIGWGANVPEEGVYPIARRDVDGATLDGARTYRIRFGRDEPPVEAFWSLSVYGSDMFFVEHPSGRYTVGDRTPGLHPGDDGSLEVTLSHHEPEDPDANWLPIPEGRFVLMLRLYLPTREVLDDEYVYPSIDPVDAP